MRADAHAAYAEARAEVDEGIRSGTLLRGEVLARWQEFVGTGELMRTLQDRIGRLRDRVTAAVTGRPQPGTGGAALESGVVLLRPAAAERAAERAATPGGPARQAGAAAQPPTPSWTAPARTCATPSSGPCATGRAPCWTWSAGRARTAAPLRALAAYGVNATGLIVMIAVFASTAFVLTGAEIGVAGGTTRSAQKVLEAVFGDQAVRTLAARPGRSCWRRVGRLSRVEADRFADLLAAPPPRPRRDGLERAAAGVERPGHRPRRPASAAGCRVTR